tara:strand:+ start:121 stop:375 length:255 start_codon:yes stop_codon:yes gene_type:complete
MEDNDNQYKDDKWDKHYPVCSQQQLIPTVTDSHTTPKSLTIKEAIAIVLEELHMRLPKTSQEGFLAEHRVCEAVNRLLKHINKS